MHWFLVAAGVVNLILVISLVPQLSQPRDSRSESQRQVLASLTRGLRRHGAIAVFLVVTGIVAAAAGWSDLTMMMAFLALLGVAFLSMAITVVGAMPEIRAASLEAKGRALVAD